MALPVGSIAPNFSLPTTAGGIFTLDEHKGSPCVLYFYPGDFTPVCTQEACSFRNGFEAFEGLSMSVYGISADSLESHKRFKARYNLPFDLLADEKHQVAKLYGAYHALLPFMGRVTYLLDAQHTIAAVYKNALNGKAHVDAILAKLKQR